MDNVGSLLWPQTLRSLAQFGRMVCVGELAPNPVQMRLAELIFRDATLLGSSGAGRANVEQCAKWIEDGKLDGIVSNMWPMDALPRALSLVRSGNAFGRIVLTP
jgi:zinc-binding alcohol dehydrogenase/oxidoreductase